MLTHVNMWVFSAQMNPPFPALMSDRTSQNNSSIKLVHVFPLVVVNGF